MPANGEAHVTGGGLTSPLDSWLAAEPDAFTQPAPSHAAASCLVVAHMLMDPAFGEWMMTGVHPHSGWTEQGPVAVRSSRMAQSLQQAIRGSRSRERGLAEHVGIAPWSAASQLSQTGRAGRHPVRYLWYPVLGRRGPVFDRLGRATGEARPTLLYLGSLLQPGQVRLVIAGDADVLRCYVPEAGAVQPWERRVFVKGLLNLATLGRPSYIVMPTGRRATH